MHNLAKSLTTGVLGVAAMLSAPIVADSVRAGKGRLLEKAFCDDKNGSATTTPHGSGSGKADHRARINELYNNARQSLAENSTLGWAGAKVVDARSKLSKFASSLLPTAFASSEEKKRERKERMEKMFLPCGCMKDCGVEWSFCTAVHDEEFGDFLDEHKDFLKREIPNLADFKSQIATNNQSWRKHLVNQDLVIYTRPLEGSDVPEYRVETFIPDVSAYGVHAANTETETRHKWDSTTELITVVDQKHGTDLIQWITRVTGSALCWGMTPKEYWIKRRAAVTADNRAILCISRSCESPPDHHVDCEPGADYECQTLIRAAGKDIHDKSGAYLIYQYGEPYSTRAPAYIVNKMVDPKIVAMIRSLSHRSKFEDDADSELNYIVVSLDGDENEAGQDSH